jgi:hypothetical protein
MKLEDLKQLDCGDGGSTFACYEFLRVLAERTSFQGHRKILEVGTHYGLSAISMALGAAESEVLTVDMVPYIEASENWRTFGLWNRIFPLVGDSRALLPRMTGHYDMAFLDGDHEFDTVICDIENAAQLCKVIAIHDTNNMGDMWSKVVERVIERFVPLSSRTTSAIGSIDWRGIGAELVRLTSHPSPVYRLGRVVNQAAPGFGVLIDRELYGATSS